MDEQERRELAAVADFSDVLVQHAQDAVESAQTKVDRQKAHLDGAKQALAEAKEGLREAKDNAREAKSAASGASKTENDDDAVVVHAETAHVTASEVL